VRRRSSLSPRSARRHRHRGADLVTGLGAVDVVIDAGGGAFFYRGRRIHLVPHVVILDAFVALGRRAQLLNRLIVESVDAGPVREEYILVLIQRRDALNGRLGLVAAHLRDRVGPALGVRVAGPVDALAGGDASVAALAPPGQFAPPGALVSRRALLLQILPADVSWDFPSFRTHDDNRPAVMGV
jgi:hypothetical protein